MTFQLTVGQKGTLRVQATAADGTVKNLPTDLAASVNNPTINSVTPDPIVAGDFTVTALAAGNSNINVTGTNENGQAVATVFSFTDSAVTDPNPTTGFIATLVNVGPA